MLALFFVYMIIGRSRNPSVCYETQAIERARQPDEIQLHQNSRLGVHAESRKPIRKKRKVHSAAYHCRVRSENKEVFRG